MTPHNDPAFPTRKHSYDRPGDTSGLTKREWMAAMFLQACIMKVGPISTVPTDEIYYDLSIRVADLLLERLKEREE